MPTLQPYIQQQYNGAIWRLEIDELSETIFIETRDEAEKQAAFSSISLLNGKTGFKELTMPERWLTGIETAFNGVLLLHNYQSEAGPAHRGLAALDAVSGETLWSNYNYAFDHLTTEGPVLYDTRIQPKKLLLIDVKTGEFISRYEPNMYPPFENHIVVPEVVLQEILPQNLLLPDAFGNSAHYLEHNNFRIVSLHTLRAGHLKQHLLVVNDTGMVYEDLLNSDIQKLQPEAFILHKNRLVCIKNRRELVVLSL